MSDNLRYDLWLTEVSDPTSAMDALSDALGDRQRAREAVLSTPAMLLHAADAEEMHALSTRLSACGVTLEARPSRRTAPQAIPLSAPPLLNAAAVVPAPAAAATPGHGRPDAGIASDLGVAKVSYYAALVAAPAYVLQPNVLLMTALLTAVTLGSSFSAVTGSVIIVLAASLTAFVLRFGTFALIVRRSHAGQTDLRLDEGERVADLLFAGTRFVFVTLLALLPAFVLGWYTLPGLLSRIAMGAGDLSIVSYAAPMALALVFPLVALPGAYAAASLGEGCGGINPLVGLVVAQRVPGAYFMTLAYLSVFWFASVALTFGGMMLVVSNVLGTDVGVATSMLSMLVMLLMFTVLDILSMIVSARILGLLTYHYHEELGL